MLALPLGDSVCWLLSLVVMVACVVVPTWLLLSLLPSWLPFITLFCTVLMAHLGYLHLPRASLRCCNQMFNQIFYYKRNHPFINVKQQNEKSSQILSSISKYLSFIDSQELTSVSSDEDTTMCLFIYYYHMLHIRLIIERYGIILLAQRMSFYLISTACFSSFFIPGYYMVVTWFCLEMMLTFVLLHGCS